MIPPIPTPEESAAYLAALRRHLDNCREKNPPPQRSALSPLEEWQCRIIGGRIIAWLKKEGPSHWAERAFLAHLRGWSDKPAVVLLVDDGKLFDRLMN